MLNTWPSRLAATAFFFAAPAWCEGLNSRLEACRSMAGDANRLACYDALVDGPSPVPTAESQFGLAPEKVQSTHRAALGVEQADEIHADLVEVGGGRRRLLTLSNGQTWEQTDNVKLRLRHGESVRIRSAASGSYLLDKLSGSRSIRVRRIE